MITEVEALLAGLGYTLLETDHGLVERLIEKSEIHVKTYCNIKKIPQPLEHVVVSLAAGELLYLKKATGSLQTGQPEGAFEFTPTVTGYEVGDESYDFASPSKYTEKSAGKAFDDLIDGMRSLSSYELELQQYRRLPWKH